MASTTVRGLCAAAGLNPRYFYENFDSLDALLLALFDDLISHAAAAVEQALDGAGTAPDARARAAIEAFLASTTTDARTARILFLEGLGSESLLRRRFTAARRLAEITMADTDDPVARDFIAGGLTYLTVSWLSGELPLDRAALTERCVALAVGTLSSSGR